MLFVFRTRVAISQRQTHFTVAKFLYNYPFRKVNYTLQKCLQIVSQLDSLMAYRLYHQGVQLGHGSIYLLCTTGPK